MWIVQHFAFRVQWNSQCKHDCISSNRKRRAPKLILFLQNISTAALTVPDKDQFIISAGNRLLDCRPAQPFGAQVMGILNITPDSFSDGGKYVDIATALRQTEAMLKEGAIIIDVGGESTRPGAAAVTEDQERQRILPVIEAISNQLPEALISVDTYKPAIAHAALEAGAHIINDVTGLRLYPEMAEIAAQKNAPLILMHSTGTPGNLTQQQRYSDVTTHVRTSLQSSIMIAEKAKAPWLITDPGFGFGKTPAENLQLLHHTDQFVSLGYPVLVGISRKSTIGTVLGEHNTPARVDERLFGTLGATAVAVLRGASLVRTHDVRPTVEMLKVLGATTSSG